MMYDDIQMIKITHYLYNAFLIETAGKKLAIDPGGLMFYWFRFTTLIPKSEWRDVTHILVTHGDPDHFWHADRMAEVSKAPLIANRSMVKNVNGRNLMLGPRDRGLQFTTIIKNFHGLNVDENLEIDGMTIKGLKATHGPLAINLGPFRKMVVPGPEERIGWGAIGFEIQVDDKKIVNLGDTILHKEEWSTVEEPDVLMIPIGGRSVGNTMNEDEALQAVRLIRPKMVIPCHYNCPAFFRKNYNPANADSFKKGVEDLGFLCTILQKAESLTI